MKVKEIVLAVGKRIHEFVGSGGWKAIVIIAILGMLAAIVSHYWILGFNWQAFLCFEIPLYVFLWMGLV